MKITPNFERARSIVGMVELIEARIKLQSENKFSSLVISDYYEVIKELITALLLVDGYKTISHKELMDYLIVNYKEFGTYSVFLNDLRVLRNRISYEGFFAEFDYLERNQNELENIIVKLKTIIDKKLKLDF
tara:strand:- start:576 stop:971 length:396 start_codon:yes stop_codon:yes gene_type:complete